MFYEFYFQVTLILEHVPKECDGNNSQPHVDDVTPSESSEAESSTESSVPEDEEEAWESGSYYAFTFCMTKQ